MKKHALALSLFVLLAPTVSPSQTAREESINFYGDISGEIFYNETFFVNDASSPVQIRNVVARHIPSDTADVASEIIRQLGRFDHLADQLNRVREYTREDLRVTISADGQDVVAVKFAVIAYDAFKERLGGLTAITMEPPQGEMIWNFSPAYLFKFKRYGVVGVYVQQARLASGEIWNFDAETVLARFREFRDEITLEQLRLDAIAD